MLNESQPCDQMTATGILLGPGNNMALFPGRVRTEDGGGGKQNKTLGDFQPSCDLLDLRLVVADTLKTATAIKS